MAGCGNGRCARCYTRCCSRQGSIPKRHTEDIEGYAWHDCSTSATMVTEALGRLKVRWRFEQRRVCVARRSPEFPVHIQANPGHSWLSLQSRLPTVVTRPLMNSNSCFKHHKISCTGRLGNNSAVKDTNGGGFLLREGRAASFVLG